MDELKAGLKLLLKKEDLADFTGAVNLAFRETKQKFNIEEDDIEEIHLACLFTWLRNLFDL